MSFAAVTSAPDIRDSDLKPLQKHVRTLPDVDREKIIKTMTSFLSQNRAENQDINCLQDNDHEASNVYHLRHKFPI